jgi:hypothetical protein
MSAGVGVGFDVGANNGSGSENGQGNGHSFIPQPNETTNDSPYLSAKDAEIKSDIEIISDLFQREAGAPFKVGRDQKPRLAALIREHGLEIVQETIKSFVQQEGNEWSVAGCPAAIYLSQVHNFILDATHQVELANRWKVRESQASH